MKDHTYIFKVSCPKCQKVETKKIYLSLYVEPEIVWRTFLVLSGMKEYVCKTCSLRSFIRKVGSNI